MYLCNLLKNEDKRLSSYLYDMSVEDDEGSFPEVKLVKEGVTYSFRNIEDVLADGETEVNILENLSYNEVGCNEGDLDDTEENPVIAVITKKVEFTLGVPTYIKYHPVSDGVLIILLKGFISVEDSEGNMIPLSRNCNTVSSNKTFAYTYEAMNSLNLLKDVESGVFYNNLVISDCLIKIALDKVGEVTRSCKFFKQNFFVLDDSIFAEGKAKKALDKAEYERNLLLKRAKEQEVQEGLANRKKELKTKEAKERAEKNKKTLAKRKKSIDPAKGTTKTRKGTSASKTTKKVVQNFGASDFLNIVNARKGN